jgi:hypothetical protein
MKANYCNFCGSILHSEGAVECFFREEWEVMKRAEEALRVLKPTDVYNEDAVRTS